MLRLWLRVPVLVRAVVAGLALSAFGTVPWAVLVSANLKYWSAVPWAVAVAEGTRVFTLDHVVPWGRSFDEYRRMFALTEADLRLRMLGCGDGPASFNAEATRRGARVISCDPIYRLAATQIRDRIAGSYEQVLDQTRRNAHAYVWDTIQSVDELGRVRMAAMRNFLEDYEAGRVQGRYLDAELPALPFTDGTFDLALCSHFLFLYASQLDQMFHRLAIRELCRVAGEVRIFPTLDLNGRRARYVDATIDDLQQTGYDVSIDKVAYEFQRGGNQMMRIRRRPVVPPA